MNYVEHRRDERHELHRVVQDQDERHETGCDRTADRRDAGRDRPCSAGGSVRGKG